MKCIVNYLIQSLLLLNCFIFIGNNLVGPGRVMSCYNNLMQNLQAPQGVHVVCKRFPRIKIVTSEIEFGLSDDFRVIPGMGEFGDRYFGTDD